MEPSLHLLLPPMDLLPQSDDNITSQTGKFFLIVNEIPSLFNVLKLLVLPFIASVKLKLHV